MKCLELKLQEKLLVLELLENYKYNTYADKMSICNEINKPIHFIDGKWKLLCTGDEITENYKGENWLFNVLESFVSAIESNGYFWRCFPDDKKSWTEIQNLKEADSKTFNPSRTLIFKIS